MYAIIEGYNVNRPIRTRTYKTLANALRALKTAKTSWAGRHITTIRHNRDITEAMFSEDNATFRIFWVGSEYGYYLRKLDA